jgi:NitT/TauT family transport system substrate-binding protein
MEGRRPLRERSLKPAAGDASFDPSGGKPERDAAKAWNRNRKGNATMNVFKPLVGAIASAVMLSSVAMAQEKVSITNIGHGYFSGPLYVAMREGLFEKHGLEADVTFVQGGSIAFQTVFTREVDFGILSYEHVLTGAAQGRNLLAVFNITHRPLNNIVVSNAMLEENRDKSLEERVQALKGKRVATPSAAGSGEKMLTVLARRYGLEIPGDLELVYLGGDPAAYVGAFEGDVIDAAMPFEPAGVMVEQENLGGTLVNIMDGEVEDFRDIIFMTLVTLPDMVKDRPELIKKVTAVFAEAMDILLDPERGKAIMGEEFNTMSPESNAAAYATVSQIWSPDGRMSLEGAKKVYSYLQPEGEQVIDFEATFTNDFLPEE